MNDIMWRCRCGEVHELSADYTHVICPHCGGKHSAPYVHDWGSGLAYFDPNKINCVGEGTPAYERVDESWPPCLPALGPYLPSNERLQRARDNWEHKQLEDEGYAALTREDDEREGVGTPSPFSLR